MKKFPKILVFLILAVFLVPGMMPSASAITITITPSTEVQWVPNYIDNTDPLWWENVPKNPAKGDIPGLVGYSGTLYDLYKQDQGGGEYWPYAASYDTTFYNSPSNPQDAEIKWVGPGIISGDPLYLLVKGGAGTIPMWYIFDLLDLRSVAYDDDGTTGTYASYDWNGTDTIFLDGFWPTQGAISHVSIYGGAPVPEPATMLLLGSGLIGLVGLGRKKFFKKELTPVKYASLSLS